MLDHNDQIRTQYTNLIQEYERHGENLKARECIDMAIRHGAWRDPSQRPLNFEVSLCGPPVHDASHFGFVPFLESHYPEIRQEFDEVMAKNEAGFGKVREEDLVQGGTWDQVLLFEGGQKFEPNCRRFPKLTAILEQIPEAMEGAGACYLSWLDPKTHITPHFGPTNTRLRVHMGILVPKDTRIRAKNQFLTWQEGKCIVFDDSYEHEVWNLANSPRVILLFDIYHPDLNEAQKLAINPGQASFLGVIKAFMTDHGLQRIQKNSSDNRVVFNPDAKTEKSILRYMADSDLQAVELVDGELALVNE